MHLFAELAQRPDLRLDRRGAVAVACDSGILAADQRSLHHRYAGTVQVVDAEDRDQRVLGIVARKASETQRRSDSFVLLMR
jgi:hypothetical protein